MACMAALTSLSTTVGTGIITGGAISYIMAGSQAKAEWGEKNGILTFYDKDGDYTTTDDGKTLVVPTEGYGGANYSNPHIVAEAAPNSATAGRVIYSVTMTDGSTLTFTDSAWPADSKFFNGYTLKNLIIGKGNGSGALELKEGNSTVIVESVSGTLTSVSNKTDGQGGVGKLTLGKEDGTIDISGTISCEGSGSITLVGTINLVDVSGLEGHFSGYTDGDNGFEVYDGYMVFDGAVDTSRATVTLKGEEITLVDGQRILTEQMLGDIYYLNSGTATYEAKDGDSLKLSSAGGTLIVSGESGSTVKLTSLALTANAETILTTAEGVTLVSDNIGQFTIDNTGRTLTVGKGVRLAFSGSTDQSDKYAIAMGNGTLNVAGGQVSADSLIMQNYQSNKNSTINITDGGLLEITGNQDGGYKTGSVRLGHWSGTAGVINVTDGELRVLNATVGMSDDGNGNLRVSGNGVANLKGITCLLTNTQLQVSAGGKLNIGAGGISQYGGYWGTAHPGVINVDNATLGALSAEGWSSSAETNIGNGAIIQLAVYNVATGEYEGAADITLSGTHTGTGALTLAGNGSLIISSELSNDISKAEGAGATLVLNGLDNFDVESSSGYTGYDDSTTDGYASGELYRVAGTGSTLDKVVVLEDGVETEYAMNAGAMIVESTDSTNFYVNTEVTRSAITELRDGSSFTINAGGVYHTDVVDDLAVTKAMDKSATIYLQNAEGQDVLKLSNLPETQVAGFVVDGNSVVADAGSYTADVTVLSGTVLSQAQTVGNDKVGANYLTDTERTITVQGGATFDIAGKEAYYHVVLEEGAVLTNTGSGVYNTSRNLPVVDLMGDATIDTDARMGMLGSGYSSSSLNLNGHTLTKTGTANVHFMNCLFSEGTVSIENGYVELLSNNNEAADYSKVAFEIHADSEAGTIGGLDFQGRDSDVLGHIVGEGGTLLVGSNYTARVQKLSGSYLEKNGLGTMVMGAGSSIESDMNIAATAGSLILTDGVVVNGDVNIAANRGSLTLGALSVAEGKTLNVMGGAVADCLSNSGAGMLKIDSLSGMVSYGSIADNMQITTLTGATVIDLFAVADQLSSGVNLGIVYSEDNLNNIQVSALDADTYELVDNGGYIKLQAKGDATLQLSSEWDLNWGARGLSYEPATVTEAVITDFNSDNKGLSEVGYLVDGQVAVKLVANGVTDVGGGPDTPKAVCGAAYDAPGTAGSVITIEKGVWIDAVAGRYGAIVGGSMAGNWGSSVYSVVNTDSHIVVDYDGVSNELFIRNVIGGNMGDCANDSFTTAAQFNGNSYVTIRSSNVGIAIVGASVTFHGGCSVFNGDSNVFVYTSLTDGGSAMRGELKAVVGGMMAADNDKDDSASDTVLNGNSKVAIDLTDSTANTDFAKMAIGGNVGQRGTSKLNGTSELSISATNANATDVKFGTFVVGGSYTNAAAVTHGDSVLNINGGTYAGHVAAGSCTQGGTVTQQNSELNITGGTFGNYLSGGILLMKSATATLNGTSTVSITDATVNGWLSGGSFTNSGNSTVKQGNVDLTINNTTFAKETVGGSFVGGSGSTTNVGDVSITVNGATFTGNLYGGVYHYNNSAASTSTVGDVTVTLAGGTIAGNIYAAGGTRGNSGNITVDSTLVEVDGAASLAAGTIVSAGFGTPDGSSPNVKVTGDRSISFIGDADQDRTGILFTGFNKIGVATAGVTATIGGAELAIDEAITINGEGTIKLAAGTTLAVNGGATIDGAVDLNGQSVVGDVTVGEGNLIVNNGTLNGALTLAAGSTLTLWDGADAATNNVLSLAVPAEEGISLLGTGNALTIGGMFNVNVGLDLNAMTEVDLITGFDVDNLTLSGITLDSENKVQAAGMVLNGTEITADQNLWLVLDGDTLKLSTIAGLEDFYWEGGDGNWTDAGWAMEDGGSDLVNIKDAATREDAVNAIFSGSAATITVDTKATVDDMSVTITGGDYVFVPADDTASLDITGTLAVDSGAKADIQMDASAGAVTITGEGSSLTVDTLTIGEGGLTMNGGAMSADGVTVAGDATVDGGTLEAATLVADSLTASNGATLTVGDMEIAGTAEITGSTVDAAGLLLAEGVTISGDTANVEAERLKVGEGGLSMSAGTLNAGSLFSGDGVTAEAEITGGTVTIGGSTLSSTTVTGAEFVGNSTLAGSADKAVTVGDITVDGAGKLTLSDATLTDTITVEDGGTLEFGGAMHLDTTVSDFSLENKSTYAATADESDLGKEIANGGNGFVSRNEIYTVVDGDLTNVTNDATAWTVGADARVGEYSNGKVTISESKDTTTYWVNTNVSLSNVSDKFVEETDTIMLNGGMLQMNEDTDLSIATNNENPHGTDSKIHLSKDVTLYADKLTIADGTTVTLTGLSGTTLDLGDAAGVDAAKLKGLTDDTWAGTVTTAATDVSDVASLGNAGSAVELTGSVNTGDMNMGDVSVVHATDTLTADSINGTGELTVEGLTTLNKGASSLSDAAFNGGLILGGDEAATLTAAALTAASVELTKGDLEADTLTVDGAVTITEGSLVVNGLSVDGATSLGGAAESTITVNGDASLTGGLELVNGSDAEIAGELTLDGSTVKYGNLDSKVVAGTFEEDSLSLEVDVALLRDAVEAGDDVTLLTLTEGTSDAEISLNGGSNVLSAYGEKYSYSLDWDEDGQNVTLDSVINENYMKEKYNGSSANAVAGATIMDEAFAGGGIGAGGDLEKILASVDGNSMTEEGLAAVAGSSTAALGMAFAGDVERQLRAIRNRTTTMGVNQCVVNEGMPYFNAWVNAEGNMGELDKDGTCAGYQLDSWGGTIGFDVDVNPNLNLGLAVTAMYGDLTVDGPDKLDGDLDTMYVSAFARYSKRAWTHTFVGTIGKMDSSYDRTVSYGNGDSYKTQGETDGMAFGLMYEVGRVFALAENGDACLQPVFNVAYRHTSVGGYKEEGSDAALDVDDQTLDTITLGAGARMQAVVGENLYNRTSVLELRALAKFDIGDRASEADVAFIGAGNGATVESAELGAFGVELGAGLSVPMGDEDSGTLFFDVSAELRSGYSNLNGTVGYRINF